MTSIEARVDVLETKISFFEKTTDALNKKVDDISKDTQYIKGKMLMLCDKLSSKDSSIYVEIIKYLIILVGAMVGVRFIL